MAERVSTSVAILKAKRRQKKNPVALVLTLLAMFILLGVMVAMIVIRVREGPPTASPATPAAALEPEADRTPVASAKPDVRPPAPREIPPVAEPAPNPEPAAATPESAEAAATTEEPPVIVVPTDHSQDEVADFFGIKVKEGELQKKSPTPPPLPPPPKSEKKSSQKK